MESPLKIGPLTCQRKCAISLSREIGFQKVCASSKEERPFLLSEQVPRKRSLRRHWGVHAFQTP